jgi:hypothetical protein
MKSKISIFISLLFISTIINAQTGGINFQGVARSTSGVILASQKISLKFSIISNTPNGNSDYVETRIVNTNAQGVFSIVIGDIGAVSTIGSFANIDWKQFPKYLKVEMDPNAGTSFILMGTTQLQNVPYAYYANGVNAENVDGILPLSKGGTGVASISALKTVLAIDQINNATQSALGLKANTVDVTSSLAAKVDNVVGKGLSTNDFTTAEKDKLSAISGTNTGDQDLSSYAKNIALDLKANTADVTSSLATKVDKVVGKGLSTNDFTTAEKDKLSAISGTNTGDQDLSGYAKNIALDLKANTADVTNSLATKVDKVTGKGLSTNDFTNAEKNKLTAITGTNTGDQDLSSYATNIALGLKANTADVTSSLATKVDKVVGKGLSTNDFTTEEKNKLTAITGTNTGDQDLSSYAKNIALDLKANTTDVTNSLATKVDKVLGKGLSTNDFTTAEKDKLTAITGINTGDQDLSGYATNIALDLKANATDVTTSLATKVDKVLGKGLSTNDFTTAEKDKLTAITGINTGDQDLSGYATNIALDLKANATDVTTSLATKVDKVTGKGLSTNDFTTAEKDKLTSITGTNTGDQDLSFLATKDELEESVSNIEEAFAKLDEENFFNADQYIGGKLNAEKFILLGENNSFVGVFPTVDFESEALLLNNNSYILIGKTPEQFDFEGWMFDVEESSLILPNQSSIKTVSRGYDNERGVYIDNIVNSNFIIKTKEDEGDENIESQWRFTPSGELFFPDNTKMVYEEGSFRIKNENGISISSTQVDEYYQIEYKSGLYFDPLEGAGLYFANEDNEISSGVDIYRGYQNDQIEFVIYNDEQSWRFDGDGRLTFPDGTTFGNDEDNVGFYIEEDEDFFINTVDEGGEYEWVFQKDGSLRLPDGTILGELDYGPGFTTNVGNGFFIHTSQYIDDTEDVDDYQWVFRQDGKLILPEDGDIEDSEGNSVISRFISEEVFVKVDYDYNNDDESYYLNFANSGLDYFDNEDFKINIDDNSFDLKIPLNHRPKNPENINVFLGGYKIPKKSIYFFEYYYGFEYNYEFEEELVGGEYNYYLKIYIEQIGIFEGNYDDILTINIDYQY